VLKERSGGTRLRFTDAERRRLARKARTLGRKVLNELETLVTPDTLLRWYRELVASKWNYSHRRSPGRPRVMKTIVDLVLQMALENPSWGYTRIRGALANLGHQVGRGSIASILKENGIEPAPERDTHTRWSTFLKAHWECLTATDFLSVEVCTIKGLVTHYILFFIDIASRSVHVAGITPHPDNAWMTHIARNFIDIGDGFLRGKRYLILDRDAKYSEAFCGVLAREGDSSHPTAGKITEFERVRGTVCSLYKGRMSESDDLPRTGISSSRDHTVYEPLPRRAKSSGARKPAAAAPRRR